MFCIVKCWNKEKYIQLCRLNISQMAVLYCNCMERIKAIPLKMRRFTVDIIY